MRNLIELQDEAIAGVLAVRVNGKRAMGYGLDWLGRNGRGVAAVRRRYERAAVRLGFNSEQVKAQWQDVKDMAELEERAV